MATAPDRAEIPDRITPPTEPSRRPALIRTSRQPRLAGNRQARVVHKLRLAMTTGGVDFNGSPGGIVSATHGEAELEDTLKALRNSVRMLKQEGEI